MASTEQLKKRLSRLQPEGGYYSHEDFLLALRLMRPDETLGEAMYRLWPYKTVHPWLIEKAEEQEQREQEEQGL